MDSRTIARSARGGNDGWRWRLLPFTRDDEGGVGYAEEDPGVGETDGLGGDGEEHDREEDRHAVPWLFVEN